MTTIKNLRDGDGLFYPRTHVKAVLNNDGTNVQNLMNSINEDVAQSEIKANVITSTGDGSLYLSNDGTYKELPPIDTDEHLYITVTSNQPQPDIALYGTVIVVNDTTDNTSESFTWNGTKIHKKIPFSHVYTVTTTAVEGYSTPDVKTFTAALQGSNEVELNSNTCVLSFESPIFAEITISYDGITRLTNSSNIIKVPYGKTVTVTPHTVEGYTAPSAFTVNADAASKTITLNYIQSQLKVNILSNQGEDDTIDAVEATVTYGSTSVKVTNSQTIAVPSDTTISISFPEVEGYKKPEDITFNHTNGISEKSGTYYTELLTVNVTSDDNNSVSGFLVTISKNNQVPSGYMQLEYIESTTRSAYIDTGYIPNSNTRVVMDAIVPDSSSAVYVMGVNDWTSGKYFQIRCTTSGTVYLSDYGSQSGKNTGVTASGRLVFDKNKNVCTIGDVSVTNTESTFTCTTNLKLLAGVTTSGTHNACIGTIYSCQIYDNDILIKDYIPAKRISDGICGLYNKVDNSFVSSASSTEFVGGTEIEEISIGSIDTLYTQTTNTGQYKIAHDTNYIVSTNYVQGYEISQQLYNFTAKNKSNTVTFNYNKVTAIDLSLYDVYGNRINRSTANCYVVREAGQYKFPLVYGNAIKNGQVNTASFTNNGSTYSHDFKNGYGDVVVQPYIREDYIEMYNSLYIDSYNVDTENVFSDISVVDDYSYVQFSINNVPSTGANCIISVRNTDVIIWSWHIWVWPHDLSPVEITNATNITYRIMPVNLASKYDDDGVHIKNWFYQWGRQHPMLLPATYNSNTDHESGNISFNEKADYISWANELPSTFFYKNSSPYNWFGDQSYYNLWDAACAGTGNFDNDTVKTVYDPCPVGWKVPNGNTFTGLSQISVANGIVKMARYSGDTTGVEFPMSGYRKYSDGSLYNVGDRGYVQLSSAHSQGNAHILSFYFNYVYPQSNARRAAGYSVRPVEDSESIQIIETISFKIDESNLDNGTQTYTALSDMTWEQWVNSSYNTSGWLTDGFVVYKINGYHFAIDDTITNIIINGKTYTTSRYVS